MLNQERMIQRKIKSFRAQGFQVRIDKGPVMRVWIEDENREYLVLEGSKARRFELEAINFARTHCLRLTDAYRLNGYRMLTSHLQMTLPIDDSRQSLTTDPHAGTSTKSSISR